MSQRVCILTSVHYPYDTRIFNKQAKSLVESGYDVTLIARGDHDPTIEIPDGLHLKLLEEPTTRLNRFIGLTQFVRTAIREDADIYHIHDPELLLSVPFLKTMTQASIIYDVHEDVRSQISKKDWIPEKLKPVTKGSYDLVERLCLPLVDEVILAERSYQSRSLYQQGHIIQNFPKIDQLPEKQTDKSETTKLIYLGRLSRPRGIKEMIEVIDQIPQSYDVIFQFVGDFSSESLRTEIMDDIKDRNLESSVEFTGRLPFGEAIERVSKADIGFALLHKEPNFVESLPTKLFEYMMCGIPVIISDVDRWERIVLENECGISVPPTDITKIIKNVTYLIDNKLKRKEMGENGRCAIESKYRWSTEEKKLLHLYDTLCSC